MCTGGDFPVVTPALCTLKQMRRYISRQVEAGSIHNEWVGWSMYVHMLYVIYTISLASREPCVLGRDYIITRSVPMSTFFHTEGMTYTHGPPKAAGAAISRECSTLEIEIQTLASFLYFEASHLDMNCPRTLLFSNTSPARRDESLRHTHRHLPLLRRCISCHRQP